MKTIAIVTDTDSSLPVDLALQHGIRQVPINLIIDGETFESGVDLDDRLLFSMLKKSQRYPTTAAPAPAAFAREFSAAIQEGARTILCVCVSRNTSSTYDSALLASQMFQHDIVVIDSQFLSMSQGFMVLTAAELVSGGASRDEVIEHLANVGKRIHTFAVLPSVRFIALSGRVSKLSANIADTLEIKPILTVQDGKLEVVSRQRTFKRAVDKMLEMLQQSCGGKPVERVAIIHANDVEGARSLQEKVKAIAPGVDTYILAEFTPGLSLHTGPGTIGISVLTGA